MTHDNPYQPPASKVDTPRNLDAKSFRHLSRGQRMVIVALLAYFAAITLTLFVVGPLASLLFPLALVLGLAGLTRILLGSRIGTISKVLLFIAMFIPLVNLLALARISHIATAELKAAGYRVGLLGVKGGYVD